MDDLVREVREAFIELDGIDIEAVCPGITSDPGFAAYLAHLEASGALEVLLEPFVHALQIVANGLVDAQGIKTRSADLEAAANSRIRAADLLRQAALLQGLPADHYKPADLPSREKWAQVFCQAMPAVGSRGRATDQQGAQRAFVVRLIARGMPVSFAGRYALIASAASRLGIECTRQQARSILLKGRT